MGTSRGALAAVEGKPGPIAFSLRRGTTLDLKTLHRGDLAARHTLAPRRFDGQGAPRAVDALLALPTSFVGIEPGNTAPEAFARAVDLAVSVEPAANALAATPFSADACGGLWGKLWPVKSAPATAARPNGAAIPQAISSARKSLTLVKVGPGTTRSPSGWKKL